MSTLIMGFGALAVDVGMLYAAKNELQVAADAAALAAAADLGDMNLAAPLAQARETAREYVMKHRASGNALYFNPNTDFETGKAVVNGDRFDFAPGGANPDAVRVTVRRTADSEGGAVPLLFANVYGFGEKDMWARAAAVLIPRDISVVIDLSNSMGYDSQLRYWNRQDEGFANTRDVWAALDGPEPSRPYIPGSELETEYANDTGPTYGTMTDWGDPLLPGAYSVPSDSGLVNLPRGYSWHESLHSRNVLEQWPVNQANEKLVSQGYDAWERWAILTNETQGYLTSAKDDGNGFTSRVIYKVHENTGHDIVTVYITSDGRHGGALSNLQISVPPGALSVAYNTAQTQGTYNLELINPDPKSGVVGLKFEGILGENGQVETHWFSFEVPHGTSMSAINVVSKAGPNWVGVTHHPELVDRWNSTRWRLRAGTVLGLVSQWHSGMNGHGGGDGDGMIEGDDEVNWLPRPLYALNWDWKTYIDYVPGMGPSEFRNRYGLKTLVSFMLDNRPEIAATDLLYATPEQPLRAVKDAVQTMVETIDTLENLDRMSLEIFATQARHQVNLTYEMDEVSGTLYQRQCAHWDRNTNVGGGLQAALSELKSARARPAARKIVVLMSDGVANIDENGNTSTSAAREYALRMADLAADDGVAVYTVSVGYSVDRELMQAIASKASGQEFYAVGSPEEYTEQLKDIFRTLGGKRPVALIE